jgi:hypothetical protein
VDFLAARSSGIQETSRFLSFYDKSGIILIGATSFFHRERYLSLVKWYASLLLQKYEVIEAMDAFHIAIMRVNRIDWFVTAEEDLGSGFDEFSVLTL